MVRKWTDAAREVAKAVAEVTSVAPREVFLNDRLLGFTYDPPNPAAAPLMLIASEAEIIVEAGKGARFELSATPEGTKDVLRIAEAVASGRLRETVKGSRVTFELVAEDGTEITGGSSFVGRILSEERRVIEYPPYAR